MHFSGYPGPYNHAHWVRSLSVHDSFGTKGWTLSVHDDFGEINFGTCVFLSYDFGTCEVPFRYIIVDIGRLYTARERLSFYAEGLQMLNGCLVCYDKL